MRVKLNILLALLTLSISRNVNGETPCDSIVVAPNPMQNMVTAFPQTQITKMTTSSMEFRSHFWRAGIPATIASNHGHNPELVTRMHNSMTPYSNFFKRGFLYSTACGHGGSDGTTWSRLYPGQPVFATNDGYLSYNAYHDGINYQIFAKEGPGGTLSIADPSEALGLYKNGVKVKNVPHPERLIPRDIAYATKDGGWLQGKRGQQSGYTLTSKSPIIQPDGQLILTTNLPKSGLLPKITNFCSNLRITSNRVGQSAFGPYAIDLWGEPVLAEFDMMLGRNIGGYDDDDGPINQFMSNPFKPIGSGLEALNNHLPDGNEIMSGAALDILWNGRY